MVINEYSYLIATFLFGIIWIIFFFYSKTFRKEILTMSFLFGFAGLVAQLIHRFDWWEPLRITNTFIGVEDFLFGFFIGGILSVVYNILFNKKLKEKKIKYFELRLTKLIFLFSLIFLFLFFFGFNSFISSIVGFIIVLSIIYVSRGDLIKNSIISGLAGAVIMFIVYRVILLFSPAFFLTFWKFKIFGKVLLFNIPLEEYFWYFFAGAFIGPLYEYWKEVRLINSKNK